MAREIVSVGIIGAGQMGTGIAQVCAQAGLSVVLNDVGADRVAGGQGRDSVQGAGPRGRSGPPAVPSAAHLRPGARPGAEGREHTVRFRGEVS